MTPEQLEARRTKQIEDERAERARRALEATTNSKPTEPRPGMAPHDQPLTEEQIAQKKLAALQLQDKPKDVTEETLRELHEGAQKRAEEDSTKTEEANQAVAENAKAELPTSVVQTTPAETDPKGE